MEPTPQQQAIIDRGRRLIDLRQSPGFHDLVTISEKLIEEAQRNVCEYRGKDSEELLSLQKELLGHISHHDRLIEVITETIRLATQPLPEQEPKQERIERILTDQEREEVRESFLVGVN